MTTQHYIFLENVRFYSYHGVAPQETAIGNEFIINLYKTTGICDRDEYYPDSDRMYRFGVFGGT